MLETFDQVSGEPAISKAFFLKRLKTISKALVLINAGRNDLR
jgi:predicted N-acyltransferase